MRYTNSLNKAGELLSGLNNLIMIYNYILCLSLVSILVTSCNKDKEEVLWQKIEGEMAGGATTVFVANSQAFATPAPNLSAENLEHHLAGDLAFEVSFVSNPSPKHGGLGPAFNNNSCVGCHPTDGRAAPPSNINDMSGLFLKISLPGKTENGAPVPVPGFGTQLQHKSIYGFEKEAAMQVRYEDVPVTFDDGTVVTLKKPVYSITDPYIIIPGNVLMSPRIGMPVFGLGLLEAITDQDILANEDVNDVNKDGISGRANYVWDPVNEKMALGRFGWKAGTPSVLAQSAGAYNEDMGITNPLRPFESTYGQANEDTTSNTVEIPLEDLESVTFYAHTLGVPAGRNFDKPEVIKGRQLFEKISCTACHTTSFTTGRLPGVPEVSNQKIYPYTDMLLHDMGEGLADNREEFLANGQEWKTRPLWGIGLTAITSGHTTFLHDGRARNLTEAILWHGGEAEESVNAFKKLSKEERELLLEFLNAL